MRALIYVNQKGETMDKTSKHNFFSVFGILLIVLAVISVGFGYYQTHNEGYDQVSREYRAYSYVDKELGSLYSPYSFAGTVNRGIASEF